MPDSTKDAGEGIYRKFVVRRVDESPKHEGCEYFVLDWKHDPFAIPAARAYAEACREKFPALAADLIQMADYYEKEPTT